MQLNPGYVGIQENMLRMFQGIIETLTVVHPEMLREQSLKERPLKPQNRFATSLVMYQEPHFQESHTCRQAYLFSYTKACHRKLTF